ncbi:MAG: radical SAM family heme chaperone HemW [Bacteroidetes bacterium]|nr:MAG: radical SAM family heme chaperone HemW [Bacteroidota bacterium]
MAGIYLHIPFCRQACYYCNFHFVTSPRHKNELLAALLKELELRREYLGDSTVETIYFGGGTPSLLETQELRSQVEQIRSVYPLSDNPEITLETNPDDINGEKLAAWKELGINRLSIGVQSFFEEDLQWMNRAHNASQAFESVQMALQYFDNITIDLIYGTPLLSNEKWEQNVSTATRLNIPHLSCYALTVEPKTPLQKMIHQGKLQDVNPDKQSEQFLLLMQWLKDAGYEHYEISNFARPGFRSRHNSAYWQGKKYLGIGPSAHSFDGKSRQWNIANNIQYTASILQNNIPFEKEVLTATQKTNEYIMTSLRTIEGLDLSRLDDITRGKLQAIAKKYIDAGLMKRNDDFLVLTKEGKLLADGIAAELFS